VLREKCVCEENMRVKVCASVYLATVFRTTRKLTMSINGLVSSCRAIAQFVYVSGCALAKGLFSGFIRLSCRYTGHVCRHVGFCCGCIGFFCGYTGLVCLLAAEERASERARENEREYGRERKRARQSKR